jgi:hypothetical protein
MAAMVKTARQGIPAVAMATVVVTETGDKKLQPNQYFQAYRMIQFTRYAFSFFIFHFSFFIFHFSFFYKKFPR